MIHLTLTHPEIELLQHALAPLAQGALPTSQPAASLLTKLRQAQQEAIRHLCCPVCQTTFTQDVAGRHGRYCSPACKQKAYRQRRLASKQQFGPSRSL
jgi:hypothetical protein